MQNDATGYTQRTTAWRNITMDNEYLFIANTGNNLGYRRNLNIIRVNNKSKF